MCISIFFAIAAHDVVFRYRHASIDPNARTMEEAYRIDYSPSQVDAGRNVVTSKVERFSVADPEGNIQILVLDGTTTAAAMQHAADCHHDSMSK